MAYSVPHRNAATEDRDGVREVRLGVEQFEAGLTGHPVPLPAGDAERTVVGSVDERAERLRERGALVGVVERERVDPAHLPAMDAHRRARRFGAGEQGAAHRLAHP
jgi:hypothetical protein